MTKRPKIESIKSSAQLRQWYWLKSDLVAEARRLGIKVTGAKFTLLERLCYFLDTGEKRWPGDTRQVLPTSEFNWQTARLTKATRITDNYKNTENVRQFFKRNVGAEFKFSIALMDWLKGNEGKTLGDALKYLASQQADPRKTVIKPHNQFNQYCRDFIEDNPNLGMREARQAWAVKRSLPSSTGRHFYEPSDLQLVTDSNASA